MQAIEPNWISLLWFAAFATVGTVALLIVAGMFPLRAAPDAGGIGRSDAAGVGNAVLLAALLIGTGLYGYAELRVEHVIIVAGLVVLFAPGLFETWPSSWRDGNDRACRSGRRSDCWRSQRWRKSPERPGPTCRESVRRMRCR